MNENANTVDQAAAQDALRRFLASDPAPASRTPRVETAGELLAEPESLRDALREAQAVLETLVPAAGHAWLLLMHAHEVPELMDNVPGGEYTVTATVDDLLEAVNDARSWLDHWRETKRARCAAASEGDEDEG